MVTPKGSRATAYVGQQITGILSICTYSIYLARYSYTHLYIICVPMIGVNMYIPVCMYDITFTSYE